MTEQTQTNNKNGRANERLCGNGQAGSYLIGKAETITMESKRRQTTTRHERERTRGFEEMSMREADLIRGKAGQPDEANTIEGANINNTIASEHRTTDK